MRTCSIEGCNGKHQGYGYCNKHYQKLIKYGDPLYSKIETHKLSNTPEYWVYDSMKQRCFNKKHKAYSRYGGRDITVCDRWRSSFIAFLEDMGRRPFPKAQLDRIDNDKGYYKENCRWVSNVINVRNQSNIKLSIKKAKEIRIEYKISKITQKQLGYLYGVAQSAISNIINNKAWT